MTKITTEKIHGKDYAPVSSRVTYFRHSGLYEGYRLVTKEKPARENEVKVLAKVYDKDDRLVSTGLASETIGSSNINKTSALENCETSAVGRALAFLGIASDGSIASSDELKTAQNKQREILEEDYWTLYGQLKDRIGEKEVKKYHPDSWKEGTDIKNLGHLTVAYKTLVSKLNNLSKTDSAVKNLEKK